MFRPLDFAPGLVVAHKQSETDIPQTVRPSMQVHALPGIVLHDVMEKLLPRILQLLDRKSVV